jgi:hypothetical protein
MAQALEVMADDRPSLADNEAFANAAVALGDPLSATVMPRSFALSFDAPYEKPAGWGDLKEWEVFGAGYGVVDDERRFTFSLFYPDADAAEGDAAEIVRRMETYGTIIERLPQDPPYTQQPFEELCNSLSASTTANGTGSTLTVTCPLKEGADPYGWFTLVSRRDLGSLVP